MKTQKLTDKIKGLLATFIDMTEPGQQLSGGVIWGQSPNLYGDEHDAAAKMSEAMYNKLSAPGGPLNDISRRVGNYEEAIKGNPRCMYGNYTAELKPLPFALADQHKPRIVILFNEGFAFFKHNNHIAETVTDLFNHIKTQLH